MDRDSRLVTAQGFSQRANRAPSSQHRWDVSMTIIYPETATRTYLVWHYVVWEVPRGSYPTPVLGRLLFKIADPNHKTIGILKTG